MKVNLDHLNFLLECTNNWKEGYKRWNKWREENPEIIPQLCDVDFTYHSKNFGVLKENGLYYKEDAGYFDEGGYFWLKNFNFENANFENSNFSDLNLGQSNLKNANFKGANLFRGFLNGCNLEGADFQNANLQFVDFHDTKGEFNFAGANFGGGNGDHIIRVSRMGPKDSDAWNSFRQEVSEINLQCAYLVQVESSIKCYIGFDFSNVNMSGAVLFGMNFIDCNFSGTNFSNAFLPLCHFNGLDLSNANFKQAILDGSNLSSANCSNSDFSKANLLGVNLSQTNLKNANLEEANLSEAIMVETNFENANLNSSKVYGTSAWDLKLNNTQQTGLIISKGDGAAITVDDLEVAQFIYLLINNDKIRNVINTVTSKTVLILGRFYKERKDVLDALRETLKEHDLAPIIFDFEPSKNRDLTETVQLLANMSKFVIADLTDAKSIPQELSHIIPFFPSVPIRPILLEHENAYSMFEHWERFESVLPIFYYKNQNHLINNIVEEIILPIDNWKKDKSSKAEAKEELDALKKKLEALKLSDPERYKDL